MERAPPTGRAGRAWCGAALWGWGCSAPFCIHTGVPSPSRGAGGAQHPVRVVGGGHPAWRGEGPQPPRAALDGHRAAQGPPARLPLGRGTAVVLGWRCWGEPNRLVFQWGFICLRLPSCCSQINGEAGVEVGNGGLQSTALARHTPKWVPESVCVSFVAHT